MKIGLAILAVMVIFIFLLGSGDSHTPTVHEVPDAAYDRLLEGTPVGQVISAAKDREAADDLARINKDLESPRIQKRTDKICKKHPEWGDAACLKIAKSETWVGMDIYMLHESIGLPDSTHVTDLGNGHMTGFLIYSPGYSDERTFYLGDGGVVTAISTH